MKSTGCPTCFEMTWYASWSQFEPGKTMTPNFIAPPPPCLASSFSSSVSRVLVEQLGRVLGDAGRLVYLGRVGALPVEERRGGERRPAERGTLPGRAQVSAGGVFADGHGLVFEHPGEAQPGQPRQERCEEDQQRPGRVPLEGE